MDDWRGRSLPQGDAHGARRPERGDQVPVRVAREARDVAEALALEGGEEELALSMGMSGDFEDAIARGATSVRVGSDIFGARAYAASVPPS